MTLLENFHKDVPEYYDYMYLDGYSPEQILHAAHKKMMRQVEEREAAQRAEAEANEIPNVKIISEVKIRR
jgi:hypothetical protein